MPLPILLVAKAIFSPAKIIGLLSNLVGFCVKYWKQILFIGMAGTIFYQNMMAFEALKWVGLRTIPGVEQEYQERIDVLQQQLHECEMSRQELKGAIEATNAQIDKWSQVSEDLQRQHNNLKGQLREMREKSDKRVQNILKEPVPKGCEAAIQYLRDAREDLKWPGLQ